MIRRLTHLVEDTLAADSAAAAGAAFLIAAVSTGASYVQIRHYRRPTRRLTSAAHWAAGGFVARHCPPGWIDRPSSRYVRLECNPLLQPIARGITRYRFSDYAPHGSRDFGRYWEAMSEGDIAEAVCATAYGADRATASLHIGLPRRDFDSDTADSLQMAGSIVAERILAFDLPADDEAAVTLSVRERDAIAFVAEGKTDWEIGVILGVSEATARFHVDNARRKLGAVNRAHAVARFVAVAGLT